MMVCSRDASGGEMTLKQGEDSLNCRWCAGLSRPVFHTRVLASYDVQYFACNGCGSLQTELPHWLDEAYSLNLSALDTGALDRNIRNLAATMAVARVLGLQNVVDRGGGDGLLCRLLRDREINCFVSDRYARPVYAQGFQDPDFERPDLVLAFEVIEHLVHPGQELTDIFGQGARAVLATTGIYRGQDGSWWYLAPESGQHVFFYSEQAFQQIAMRYGYVLFDNRDYLLFCRVAELTTMKRLLLRALLKPSRASWLRSWAVHSSKAGAWNDHQRVTAQMKSREAH